MDTAPEHCAAILAAIAQASAARPARYDQVIERLGIARQGADAALTHLQTTSQIAHAEIKRAADPPPWLAIWPTGVIRPAAKWNNLAMSSLYTPHKSPRDIVKEANAPKVQPERAANDKAPPPPQAPPPAPAPAKPRLPRPRPAPRNDTVVCELGPDGSLQVTFGPDYLTDVCAVFVQDLRRQLAAVGQRQEARR